MGGWLGGWVVRRQDGGSPCVATERDPPGVMVGGSAGGGGTPSLPGGGIRAAKKVMILAYAMRQGNG